MDKKELMHQSQINQLISLLEKTERDNVYNKIQESISLYIAGGHRDTAVYLASGFLKQLYDVRDLTPENLDKNCIEKYFEENKLRSDIIQDIDTYIKLIKDQINKV